MDYGELKKLGWTSASPAQLEQFIILRMADIGFRLFVTKNKSFLNIDVLCLIREENQC